MRFRRQCRECKTIFYGGARAKYCSPACRRKAHNRTNKEWRKANLEHCREYQRDYMRSYREDRKPEEA